MSRLSPADFERAAKCPSLNQRVPSCSEISGQVAYELWEATLSNHQAWPKEKIFLAALGIALQLSRAERTPAA